LLDSLKAGTAIDENRPKNKIVYESQVGCKEYMVQFNRCMALWGSLLGGSFLAFSILSLNALFSSKPATAGYAGNLEVRFQGLKSAKGQVCLTLFSGPKGFPKGGKGSNLKASRCTTLTKDGGVVVFNSLPYGVYAIAAVHDSNSDNRLNQNGLGIPTEGFGFSSNPPFKFGPASFSEAQFFLSGINTVEKIQMRYLN
jgi:uncharacterized protein (DUF2141 family)